MLEVSTLLEILHGKTRATAIELEDVSTLLEILPELMRRLEAFWSRAY